MDWTTNLSDRERIKKIEMFTPTNQDIEIFFSYADEDEELRDELEKHLVILQRQKIIETWHKRKIVPGAEWAGEINYKINSAHIILLLISIDFIRSDYCYEVELKRAIERHNKKEAYVIPIILRPIEWNNLPFSELEPLPKGGKPITDWSCREQAFISVSEGIRQVVDEIVAKSLNTTAGINSLESDAIGTFLQKANDSQSLLYRKLKELNESDGRNHKGIFPEVLTARDIQVIMIKGQNQYGSYFSRIKSKPDHLKYSKNITETYLILIPSKMGVHKAMIYSPFLFVLKTSKITEWNMDNNGEKYGYTELIKIDEPIQVFSEDLLRDQVNHDC
jgi:hypothetical protein